MQRRLHTIWLAVYLLLLHWTVSVAYTAELKIEKTLTEADGLVSNTVLTVFEDSHGNIWFGTTDGLTRYDGKNFQTFTTEDGLARNTIGLIFQDRQGMLWFADGVLSHFLERGKSMDLSWMETPLSELDITPYDEIPTGMRKSIPLGGVSRYDGQTFKIFTTADGLPRNTIKDIFEDETGTLWFATGAGVSHYNGETFNTITMNGPIGMQVLPDRWDEITAIAQDTAGKFLVWKHCRYYLLQPPNNRFPSFCYRRGFHPFPRDGECTNSKHNRSAVRCEGKPLDEPGWYGQGKQRYSSIRWQKTDDLSTK